MKPFLPLFLAFILIFIFVGNINAQGHLVITGKIIDKTTKKPVAYAHVGIPEKGIGTTSGHNGGFQFKVPQRYSNSTMIVSFIGYKTFRKPINQINSPATIYIEQSPTDLTEVVVMEQNAVEGIIRKAVRNIPKNFSTHATTVLGFYRESRTDDSLRFIYLAEGVLNIYKTTYRSHKEGQVSLVQGRKINLRNPLDTVVRSGFSSGHMAGHRFDFVKNLEDFIDEDYFPVYKYWVESITYYNDRPVYIIGFDKDKDAPEPEVKRKKNGLLKALLNRNSNSGKIEARMRGRIFIDKESFAFIRAEFEILPEGLKKWNDYPLYAGTWKANSYVVNYRQLGDKWHFSDALREGEYGRGGMYMNEIKITEINPESSEPLPYLDRMQRGQEFVRMTGVYDEDFWKNFNTTPLNEELVESVQQFKNAIKAKEVFDAEYMASLRQQRDSIEAVKLLERQEEMALETGKSLEDFEFNLEDLNRVRKIKRKIDRVKFMMGTGVHLLSTQNDPLNINYFDESGETILSVNNAISKRDFEITGHFDFDIYFKKYFYLRFGSSFDFHNSIYKNRSIGVGTQVNLSKQRPVFLKAIAQYDFLRYARKVDDTTNEYGKFKVDGKKFKANKIRLNYGNRLHNLKLSGELSIELNPSRELYFRGNYYWNFAHKQDVWFKEKSKLFPKKKRLSISDPQLSVTENDIPFNEKITPDQSFSISVGLLFK